MKNVKIQNRRELVIAVETAKAEQDMITYTEYMMAELESIKSEINWLEQWVEGSDTLQLTHNISYIQARFGSMTRHAQKAVECGDQAMHCRDMLDLIKKLEG